MTASRTRLPYVVCASGLPITIDHFGRSIQWLENLMAKLHTAIGNTRLLSQSKQQSFSLCESLKKKKKVTASWSTDGWAASSAEPEREARGSDEEIERVVGGSARLWPPSVQLATGWISPKKWRVTFRVNTDTFVLWLINNETEKPVSLNFAAWLASISGRSPP